MAGSIESALSFGGARTVAGATALLAPLRASPYPQGRAPTPRGRRSHHTLENPTQPEVHVVVGIDVSKRHLDVCLRPEVESFVLSNDQEGIDSLLGRLESARPELVILEATGGYERLAATSIAAAGIEQWRL
jgi:hypothetical protein